MIVLIFLSVALFLSMHCIAQPKIVFADGKKKILVCKVGQGNRDEVRICK